MYAGLHKKPHDQQIKGDDSSQCHTCETLHCTKHTTLGPLALHGPVRVDPKADHKNGQRDHFHKERVRELRLFSLGK